MALPIEIEVWQGEIAELEVDGIVIPANETLFMTAPIAASVKRHAGDMVEREAVNQGPIAAGSAVVTAGGGLAAPYLIHAVGVGHDLRPDAARLTEAINAALAAADRLDLRRIAVAPLGTERGVFSTPDAARLLFDTLIEHVERHPGRLESVVVAVPRSDELAAYHEAMEALAIRHIPPVRADRE
jgi:O-acetyl-ADP-ribose deacetylase (regulator of RNase III)